MSDGPLRGLRDRSGGSDDSTPRRLFDRLREWYAETDVTEAARDRVGQLVIHIDPRDGTIPLEVAADPDVHVSAKHGSTGRTAAERSDETNRNGVPLDQRNYDPDRRCRREARRSGSNVSVDRSSDGRRGRR